MTALSLFCALAAISFADAAPPVAYEYPSEFAKDEEAGLDGRYALRIVHRPTNLGFRFVRGGRYTIGSEGTTDSAVITVEVTDFYIAERQLSYAQTCKLARQYALSMRDEVLKNDAGLKMKNEAFQERGALGARYFSEHDTIQLLSGAIHESLEVRSRLHNALGIAWGGLDDEAGKASTLTDADRRAFASADEAFAKAIASLDERGQQVFDRTYFRTADSFARQVGCRLPTEAQWEVAARLVKSEQLPLDGMFDEVLEWCSDYYAWNYFKRTSDVINPSGPKSARLSLDQLRDESPSFLRGRRMMRRVHVLRGSGVSGRGYGLEEGGGIGIFTEFVDDFKVSKGIRLVLHLDVAK